MFYYDLLNPRVQRLESSSTFHENEKKEKTCQYTSALFKGSFEEEMLHKLGDKIDANGVVQVNVPYKNRALGKESVSHIKRFFNQSFNVQKIFDSHARRKLKLILESRSLQELAKSKGKLDKLQEFLRLPLFTENKDILLTGNVHLSNLFALFLTKAKQKHINLKGGLARYLVLPWALQSLQQRLDASLALSPKRKEIITSDRPDWDFVIHTSDPEKIQENYQVIYEELAKSLFKNMDPDFLPYYTILVEKVMCKSGEHHTGTDLSANISFGDGIKNKVDLTQQQIIRSTQLFELHGLEISIDIKALQRWTKNPHDEKITQQDLDEVLVNIDRNKDDEGLQASLDLAYGILHSKNLRSQDRSLFARLVYWITNHSLYYEPELRLIALHTLINYQKTGVAKQIAEQIKICHDNHGMNQPIALQAMWVNTLIALHEELGKPAENLCQELLSYSLPSLSTPAAETLFHHILASRQPTGETVETLAIFAFIRALGVNEGEEIQVYLTRDLKRLQITDKFSCLVQLNPNRVIDAVEQIPLENYIAVYERLLAGTRFDRTRVNFLKLSLDLDWAKLERFALCCLHDSSSFKQQFGYTLLLACSSAHESFASYRTLVKYFPEVLINCPKEHRMTLKSNFDLAMSQSIYSESFQDCFSEINLETLEDPVVLKQNLVIAISPWDFKQAIGYWNEVNSSLSPPERIGLGKRIMEKMMFRSPSAALSIFISIHEHLSQEEEMDLFLPLLYSCYSPKGVPFKWNDVISLQSVLLTMLRRNGAECLPEKRKVLGKKKGYSPKEMMESRLINAKTALSKLVFCCLELSPDEDALELFALAAKRNLIEQSGSLYDCFDIILRHPQGQKKALIQLWLLCKKHHLELPNEINHSAGLKICEDLIEESDQECIEVVNQVLPVLLKQNDADFERCVALLVKRLEHFALSNEADSILNLITAYQHLIAPNTLYLYRQYLFKSYLERNDLKSAFAQLPFLNENGTELESLMNILRVKISASNPVEHKEIRLFLEDLIALYLTKFSQFNAPLLSNYLFLCSKLLDNPSWNNEPPSKSIREKIRSSLPAIIEASERRSTHKELAGLMMALHFRQMLPPCPPKIVIHLCQTILNTVGKDREQLEQIHQILSFYKLLHLTGTPGHPQLVLDMISALLGIRTLDSKGSFKLFDKILDCLEYASRHDTSIISPDLLYASVAYFKDSNELDAERLMVAAKTCTGIAGSQQFKAAYALLATCPSHLERSIKILVEQKNHLLSFSKSSAQKSAAKIIEAIIKTPTSGALKNAIMCVFDYDLNQENVLVDNLLNAIASQPDPDLLDHAWVVFDRYFKTSSEWVFLAHVLHRFFCLIAEKKHGRIDELMFRFPEFYAFSMRAAVNSEDMVHFKAFKAFLIAHYPDYIEEINKINFTQLPEIVADKPLLIGADDQLVLPVCLAYKRYLETTPSRIKFHLANSLFKELFVSYINRAMDRKNPAIFKQSKEAQLLFRIATCANVTTARFNLNFTVLSQENLDRIDHLMLHHMLASEMEEQVIAYLELCVLNKHNVKEVQRILEYIVEKAIDNHRAFSKLFAVVFKIAKRYDHMDIFPLIALFLQPKDLSLFSLAFELFDLHIRTNTCIDPHKPYSLIIQDLVKNILLSQQFLQGSELLHSNRLDSWIINETKAILWSTLYSRKFDLMVEKGNYYALSHTITHLISNQEILKCSESALQMAFEDAIDCMLNETKIIASGVEPRLAVEYLKVSLSNFRENVLRLIRNLSHCEEYSIVVTDEPLKEPLSVKHGVHLRHDNTKNSRDYTEFDTQLRSALEMIIELSQTDSHEKMRKKVLEKYSFFKTSFPLNFKTQEDKNVYFLLNKTLIKFLSRVDSDFEYQATQLMQFQSLQIEYLIENFPERHADIVKLLNRAIFTCQHLEFEYSQRLNFYAVVKYVLTQDVLKKYPDLFYQKLIFLSDKPFQFPELSDKISHHITVIRSLLHSGVHRMIQRGMEMLNEIPRELVDDVNNTRVYELFHELLKVFAADSETLLSRPAYVSWPSSAIRVKTFNDCLLEVISNSPIFSDANPARTPTCLVHATFLANTYLVLLLQSKLQLGITLNYTAVELYQAFYLLFEKGLFAGNIDMYLDLVPHLKNEILGAVVNSSHSKTFNKRLHQLNLVKLLTLKKQWGPLEKKVVILIQNYLTDLIEITLKRNDQAAGGIVWEQFVQASEHFRIGIEYRAIHLILMKKFEKILNPKKTTSLNLS